MNYRKFDRVKSGIATTVIAVIVIVVIAVVGVGAYLALSSAGSNSTSTASSQQTSSVVATTSTLMSSAVATSSTSESSVSSSETSASESATSTSSSVVSTSLESTTIVQTSYSCSTTYSGSTSPGIGSLTGNLANLFGNFSAISVQVSYSSNGTTGNVNESYSVQGTSQAGSVTIYSVVANISATGYRYGIAFTYGSNGTVLSLSLNGTSVPQVEYVMVTSLMAGFTLELTLGGQFTQLINSSYLTKVNSTQVTLGPTTMSVTNYKAASTPFTYSYCGANSTIDAFNMQVGSVPGTNFGPILTYLYYQGTASGAQSSATLKIISIAKAA